MAAGPADSHPTDPALGRQFGGGGLIVQGRLIAHEDDLAFSFISSGGPGGQNVNKRATKCVVRVALGALALSPGQLDRLRLLAGSLVTAADELIVSSDEHRSQERNRSECMDRLADLMRRAMVTPKVRRATKPSRGAKERRLSAKKIRGDAKKRRGERHE